MTSRKDQLKGGLDKSPRSRTAHSSLIPNLNNNDDTVNNNKSNVATTTDFNADTNITLDTTRDSDTNIDNNSNNTLKENDHKALQNQLEQMEADIVTERTRSEELMRQIHELRSEKEKLVEQVAEAQSQKEDYVEQNATLVSRVGELEEQIQFAQGTDSVAPDTIVEEFAKERLLKQLGKKKTDTYRQDGYYQDLDIQNRLNKYLKKSSFDKSTIINAALNHLLTLLGY